LNQDAVDAITRAKGVAKEKAKAKAKPKAKATAAVPAQAVAGSEPKAKPIAKATVAVPAQLVAGRERSGYVKMPAPQLPDPAIWETVGRRSRWSH
jgi:hypothetical protein